jgi:tetratricopeptide (TPR) repeat protein
MALSKTRRMVRVALVGILAGIVFLGYRGWRLRQPDAIWGRAQQALAAGQLDAAKISLQALVQRDPEHLVGHATLGRLYFDEAQFAKDAGRASLFVAAQEHLARAWELRPGDLEVGRLLLAAYLENERFSEAAQLASRILRDEPQNDDALYARARHAFESGENREASAALELARPQARILALRAALTAKMGDQTARKATLAQAVAMLVRLEGEPEERELPLLEPLVADAVVEAENPAQAEERVTRVLKWTTDQAARIPAKRAAKLALFVMHALIKHHPLPSGSDVAPRRRLAAEVERLVQAGRGTEEIAPRTDLELASIAAAVGDERALDWIERGLAAAAKDPAAFRGELLELHLEATKWLVAHGEFKAAQAHLQPLLDDRATAGWGQFLTGIVAFSEGRYETALKHLQMARNALGGLGIVRFELARTLLVLQQWEAALPVLASLHVKPGPMPKTEQGSKTEQGPKGEQAWTQHNLVDDAEIHLREVEAHLALGHWQEAETHAQALAGTKWEPVGLALQAAWLWSSNDQTRSVELLKDARQRFPEDVTLAELELKFLQQAGQRDQARRLVEDLAARYPDQFPIQLLRLRWQMGQGEQERALSSIDGLIEKFPSAPLLLLFKAQLLLERGDQAQVLDVVQALRRNPTMKDAANLLESALALQANDIQHASQALEATSEKGRQGGTVDLLQANIALAQNRYDVAVENFTATLEHTRLRGRAIEAVLRSLRLLAAEKSAAVAEAKLDEILKTYTDQVDLILAKAEFQIQQENFTGAFESLDRAEKQQPESPFMALRKAQLWSRLALPQQAAAQIDRALQLAPRNPAVRAGAASVYLTLGQYAAALGQADAGLRMEPQNLSLQFAKTLAWATMGRKLEASQLLAKLIKQSPQASQMRLVLADLYFALENPERGAEVVLEACRELPNDAHLQGWGLKLLLEAGRDADADRLVEMCTSRDSGPAVALRFARAYLNAARFEPARDWAQRALERAGDRPTSEPRRLLAEIALAEGQAHHDPQEIAAARELFRALWEQAPSDLETTNRVAALLAYQFHDLTEARRVAESACQPEKLGDAPSQLLETLLYVYRQTGETALAHGFLESVLAARPNCSVWLFHQADFLYTQRDFSKAFDALSRAQKLEPWSPRPAYAKAQIWVARQRSESAFEELNRALEIDPDYLPARLLAVEQALALNKNQIALEYIERALKQDPEAARGGLLHAEVLQRLGRTSKARDVLTALLKKQPQTAAAYVALSKLDRSAGALDAALKTLTAGRSQLPNDLTLLQEQLRLLVSHDRVAEAEERAAQALIGEPAFEQTLAVAQAFVLERKWDLARGPAERALKLASPDQAAGAEWLLGNLALAAGRESGHPDDFTEACTHYTAVLARQPGHVGARNNLLWLLAVELGQPERALELAGPLPEQQQIGELPDEFLDTLVTVYAAAKRLEPAEKFAEALISLKPDTPQWIIVKAGLIAKQGDLARGLSELRRLEGRLPAHLISYQSAKLWAQGGLPERAVEELNVGLQIRADHLDSRNLVAELLLTLGQASAALGHAEAGLRQDPQRSSLALLRARALNRLSRHPEAVASLDRLIRGQPRLVQAYVTLADCELEFGRPQEALSALRPARLRWPRNLDLGEREMRALCRLNRGDEAVQVARTLAGGSPTVTLCIRWSRTFLESAQIPQARHWAAQAQRPSESRVDFRVEWLLGDIALQAGREPRNRPLLLEAQRRFQEVLTNEPRHFRVATELAEMLWQEFDQPQAALELLERVRQREPAEHLPTNFLQALAAAFRQTGRAAEGRKLLEEATVLYPGKPEFHYELALIYLKVDQMPNAVREFRAALEKGLEGERAEAARQQLAALAKGGG